MARDVLIDILLGLAVTIALISAVGMAMVSSTYQRLHFSALVVSFSSGLVAIAVWIDPRSDAQACIKVLITVGLTFAMNSILGHATARAVRIRRTGNWDPQPGEQITVLNREYMASEAPRRRRRKK